MFFGALRKNTEKHAKLSNWCPTGRVTPRPVAFAAIALPAGWRGAAHWEAAAFDRLRDQSCGLAAGSKTLL